jgi:hypothetical protein
MAAAAAAAAALFDDDDDDGGTSALTATTTTTTTATTTTTTTTTTMTSAAATDTGNVLGCAAGATAEARDGKVGECDVMKPHTPCMLDDSELGAVLQGRLVAPTGAELGEVLEQLKERLKEGGGETIYELGLSTTGGSHVCVCV